MMAMCRDRQAEVYRRAPDGGWGYFVLAGNFLAFSIIGGITMCHTLIYQELIDKLGQSASATAWVFGLQGAVGFCFSPVSSVCCKRYGSRVAVFIGTVLMAGGTIASAFPASLLSIYFTFGLIMGMGHSLAVTGCLLIIPLYFDKKRARANGIVSVGISLGGMVLGPLLTVLFAEYSYQGTVIIIGGLLLNCFVSASLFRPICISSDTDIPSEYKNWTELQHLDHHIENNVKELENGTQFPQDGNKTKDHLAQENKHPCNKILYFSLITNRYFFGFCVANLGNLVCMSTNTFLAGVSKERHFSNAMIGVILLVTSAANCLSRLLSGFLFDLQFIKKRRMITFLLLEFLAGFTMCLLPFASTVVTISIMNIATNVFSHTFQAQYVTILCDMVGEEKMPDTLGMARIFMGVGWLCGPVIGGLLKDWSGNYNASYYFGGTTSLVAMAICTLLNIPHVVYTKIYSDLKTKFK